VTITPRDRDLEIETRGNVPEPQVRTFGTFVERRWRVDLSPPALEEPESPPITEFLPSVRVGWGISLEDAVDRLVDAASYECGHSRSWAESQKTSPTNGQDSCTKTSLLTSTTAARPTGAA
jgi:hypothetical protein